MNPSEIKIITEPTSISVLKEMASSQFIDMIKAVVDIDKKIMAVGGSLHADEEKMLLENGSEQINLWGINIYFDVEPDDVIEFDSMINLRPNMGNKTRGVDSLDTQKNIIEITRSLINY